MSIDDDLSQNNFLYATYNKSSCANERKIKAGKENVPMKAFKPFVSLCVISPDFPAMYLWNKS